MSSFGTCLLTPPTLLITGGAGLAIDGVPMEVNRLVLVSMLLVEVAATGGLPGGKFIDLGGDEEEWKNGWEPGTKEETWEGGSQGREGRRG